MKRIIIVFSFLLAQLAALRALVVEHQLSQQLSGTTQFFGTSVSLCGDYAFSSSDLNTSLMGGRVRVFKNSNGVWSQTQSISRPNGCGTSQNVSYEFGSSIDAQADWLAVGAPMWDSDCLGNIGPDGNVVIYRRIGEVYEIRQVLSDPSFNTQERFGESISFSGEWLFVGASSKNLPSATSAGAVFVYRYDVTTQNWLYFQTLTASSSKGFGCSVNVDGNYALIGSKYKTEGTSAYSGAAYFFIFNGSVWSELQKVTYDNQPRYSYFGETVAISGSNAAVGTESQKTIYTYKLTNGVWTRKNTLTENNNYFGQRIAIEGNYLLASDYQRYVGPTQTGAAILYKFQNDSWEKIDTISPSNGSSGGAFAKSLALDNGRIITGAPNTISATGATYIYTGAIIVPEVKANFAPSSIIKGVMQNITFTDQSVSSNTTINSWAWDFNGDGTTDSQVASPVHQFSTPGVYPVALTVSDGNISSSVRKLVTIISASEDTCFSYIPLQGLESEKMGTAAWNVTTGGGSEVQATGHNLPQPPASIQTAYYYLGSRDYGSIDVQSNGAMHAMSGMERWSKLQQALVSNGFTPEDITISFGLMSLGSDLENIDWAINNNIEYRTYRGGTFSIKLAGQDFISGSMPEFNMKIEYNAYQGSTDKISGDTGFGNPENNSFQSSQAVKNVADAFLEDCGNSPLKFIFSSIQSANQFEFTGNARNGGFFEIQQGFLIKACPCENIIVNAGDTMWLNPNESDLLSATVSGGQAPYTFAWSPAIGLTDSTLQTPTVNLQDTMVYTLIVKDRRGCTGTATKIVNVLEMGSIDGFVRDISSNNAIPGASVVLSGGLVDTTITDNYGYYRFDHLFINNNYTLKVNKDSYQENTSLPFEITGQQTLLRNFLMERIITSKDVVKEKDYQLVVSGNELIVSGLSSEHIQLFDSSGKKLLDMKANNITEKIAIWDKGLYLLKIKNEKKVKTIKLIISN